MEEFIEYVRLLINTLNFKVFEPLIKDDLKTNYDEDIENLFIKGARGADGQGKRAMDGFIVFKDSVIASKTVPSFPKSVNSLRNELIENNIIIEKKEKLVFVNDYLFSSPSAAAMIIMGRSANGLLEWKNNSGTTLNEIESSEIEKANNRVKTEF